jgi:hypothetical protein
MLYQDIHAYDIEKFKDDVNLELKNLDLESEFIDYDMSLKYILNEYSVEEAVDDICETLELMMKP